MTNPSQLPPVIGRPGGLLFYRWWCGLFVLIYLGMAVEEILVATGRIEPQLGLLELAASDNDPQARAEIIASERGDAPGTAGFCAVVAAVYGFAACVPRKPWAWMFSMLVICTTFFPFILTLAGTIPLVICWTKPAIQAYFHRR